MSNNPRNKNLLVIIGVLLLTNISVLGYFLWFKKEAKPETGKDNRYGLVEMLQKEVGFDEEQIAQYKQLKDKQRETVRPMYDDMRKLKDSLFQLLSSPSANDSTLNKLTDVIAQKQKTLDLQTFHHFKKVRALCREGQQIKYDTVVLRVFRKMGKPQSPRSNETDKTEKKN
jgi:mevalonate kinase